MTNDFTHSNRWSVSEEAQGQIGDTWTRGSWTYQSLDHEKHDGKNVSSSRRIEKNMSIYIYYIYNTWSPFVLCFASKRRSFPIKARVIWVPGNYI